MKKNIIFFLPNFSKGGAGNSILKLCKNLNKKKYNIFTISLKKNSYKTELEKNHIKVFEVNISKTIFALNFIVKNILKKNKLDKKSSIFISNINYANVLSLIVLKIIYSYKVAIIERTPLQELDYFYGVIDFFKKKITKILMFFFYKKADLIICNSKKTSIDIKISLAKILNMFIH